MVKKSLEPGLISAFRLLLVARLLIQVTAMLSPTGAAGDFRGCRILAFGEVFLALGYLSWPVLAQHLGRMYLPLALVIVSLGPLVENSLCLRVGQPFAPFEQWEWTVILLVPLLIGAWQYGTLGVVVFALGVGMTRLALQILLLSLSRQEILRLLPELGLRTLTFLFIGYLVGRLANAQRAQRDALAQANARLIHYSTTVEKLALSQERNRLARELHDTLAHSLSEIAVQLEALKTIWRKDPARAQDIMDQTLLTTRKGLQEARRAIQALRAAPLDDLGLVLAIRELAEAASRRAELRLHFHAPDSIHNLPPEVEQCIYRIAQEAISNVVEHSQARHLRVELEQKDGRFALLVADDGCGFDPAHPPEDGHFGLRGMRERAEMIGAALTVQSAPGQGTQVSLAWRQDDWRADLQ
ncbi:MAG TPA: sensor histidine kinase [Anaerolineales bacterium]|nr:sensor histidine kinase [Anaerolineales bacterium]